MNILITEGSGFVGRAHYDLFKGSANSTRNVDPQNKEDCSDFFQR